MQCPECGSPNPDTALRCGVCNAALISHEATSPVANDVDIQSELAAAQEAVRRLRRYIPPIVAEGILGDRERLRGERREVTVLFADAVDFTSLAA